MKTHESSFKVLDTLDVGELSKVVGGLGRRAALAQDLARIRRDPRVIAGLGVTPENFDAFSDLMYSYHGY